MGPPAADGDRSLMTAPLVLDDLRVGQRFTSAKHVVGVDQIKRFAGEFDAQPFHLDEEAAAKSLFGGLAASGWHTAAITMRLLVQGGAPIAGGIVGAGAEIAWPQPTRPGDELQVFGEVTEITPSLSFARITPGADGAIAALAPKTESAATTRS
jgi:acyl dehydratase